MKNRAALTIVAAILSIAGCAVHPPTLREAAGRIPPVAADKARLYVYRVYGFYSPSAWPTTRVEGPDRTVYLDGRAIGVSAPGNAFFRDIPPGSYEISTTKSDPGSDEVRTVMLTAGDVAYAEVSDDFVPDETVASQRPSFRVRLVDPAVGRRKVLGMWYDGGGPPDPPAPSLN